MDHRHSEQHSSTGFGRGWIPQARDIGVPDDGEGATGWTPPPGWHHNHWTPARKARFLDVLSHSGNVRLAYGKVGVSPEAAYRLRRREAMFADGWAAALVLARDESAQTLADRALNGVTETIWYRGEQVGARVRFDNRLLLAHLARLDKLADETRAGQHARRFDELLALIAGEEAPAALADTPDDLGNLPDPYLPMERERYIDESRKSGERHARAIPDSEEFDSEEDAWVVEQRAREDAEIAAEQAIRSAVGAACDRAAARWDGWNAHACRAVDILLAEAESDEAERGAAALPHPSSAIFLRPEGGKTVAALDCVNGVNLNASDAIEAPRSPVSGAGQDAGVASPQDLERGNTP